MLINPTIKNPDHEQILQFARQLAERHDDLEAAVWVLDWFDQWEFGIEYQSLADREMSYVNTGDTYSGTVIKEGDVYSVGSWGDWYEAAEQEHCEENDVIRCGYCGEFTPCEYGDDEDWHDCVCESCGHKVGGG